MKFQSIAASFALAGALFAAQAVAQTAAAPVSVENAWVRAPVAGQKATGAFMRITAKTDQRLVRADSPVAEWVRSEPPFKGFTVDTLDDIEKLHACIEGREGLKPPPKPVKGATTLLLYPRNKVGKALAVLVALALKDAFDRVLLRD